MSKATPRNMGRTAFEALVSDVYAGFGCNPPGERSRDIWFEQCGHVPSGPPLEWIRQRLLDGATLPRNLGQAIRVLWEEWQANHPEQVVSDSRCCPECDVSGVIFAWAPARDPRTGADTWQRLVRRCRCHPGGNGETRRDIEALGLMVMPHGYVGGTVAFERERLGLYPDRGNHGGPVPRAVRAFERGGVDWQERPEHERARAEALAGAAR